MSHLNHEQQVSVLGQVRNCVGHEVFTAFDVAGSAHGAENCFWS